MAIVPAVCTQCGAQLEVDNSNEAAVCKFCGTPFVVEKAINVYETKIENKNNFYGQVNITDKTSFESLFSKMGTYKKLENMEKQHEVAEKMIELYPEKEVSWYEAARTASNNFTEYSVTENFENYNKAIRNLAGEQSQLYIECSSYMERLSKYKEDKAEEEKARDLMYKQIYADSKNRDLMQYLIPGGIVLMMIIVIAIANNFS